MTCPACGTETPAPLERCFRCSTPLPSRAPEAVTLPPVTERTVGLSGTETLGHTSIGAADSGTAPTIASSGRTSTGAGSLQIGEAFGRYQIICRLGSGGMGACVQGVGSGAR